MQFSHICSLVIPTHGQSFQAKVHGRQAKALRRIQTLLPGAVVLSRDGQVLRSQLENPLVKSSLKVT